MSFVSIEAIRSKSCLPSRISSDVQIPFATSASRQAALSITEPCVVGKLRPRLPLSPPIAFGCIEQRGETGAIKLIGNFRYSRAAATLLDVREQCRHPFDETKL